MSAAQSGDIVREVGTQLVHVHRVGHDGVVHRFSSLSACRSHSHIRQSKKSARPDHRPQGRCVSAVRPNKRRLRNSLLARPAATSWVCWVPERRRERCRPKPELPPRSTQQQPAGRPRPSLLRVSLGGFDNVFPQTPNIRHRMSSVEARYKSRDGRSTSFRRAYDAWTASRILTRCA